jgi:hypothetical protein
MAALSRCSHLTSFPEKRRPERSTVAGESGQPQRSRRASAVRAAGRSW